MADFREQRAAVKFCFLLGKSGTETLEMLKTAYQDLGMKRVAAKFVPRLLTAEQKQGRVEACCALKEES
ncbi:hypothetical protein B7P43_G05264 [Cryptotermes secundus]|uniref:Mos1 transposase HTH domain-containing protein n=1 Tax=Cryptotermes secundus TaxID=105785 RepID=A0A2J7PUR9_9NEOP|nr:hypothetical protein B7P43_G05264 [Cryptotermes secundus]